MNSLREELLRAREQAAEMVVAATSESEAERIYNEEYFPAALSVMDSEAAAADVLIATVGTQPYSVALSLRKTPAKEVYLIHTRVSEASARKAALLSGLSIDPHLDEVDEANSVETYQSIRKAVEKHPGKEITIDITSGTKAMTAAASAVAGLLGLQQVYISSSPLGSSQRKTRFFGRERAQVVDHPLKVFGDAKRLEAERAFNRRMFEVAELLFRQLADGLAPGYHFRARAGLCLAYRAWESLRFDIAARGLRETALALVKTPQSNMSQETLTPHGGRIEAQSRSADVLAKAIAKGARPANDPGLFQALLRFLLASARRRVQVEPDLAALLLYRSLELSLQRRLAMHGLNASEFRPEDPETLLSAYNAGCRKREHQLCAIPGVLGLAQSQTMLLALRDEVIVGLSNKYNADRFQGVLESRNKSIYAHGFRTLDGEEVEKFQEVVLAYARAISIADGWELSEGIDVEFDFVEFTGC